jgi:hypothetical protein
VSPTPMSPSPPSISSTFIPHTAIVCTNRQPGKYHIETNYREGIPATSLLVRGQRLLRADL